MPSRDYFADRKWPAGYEFPACEECNAATANIEQLIAFISLLTDDPVSSEAMQDFHRRALANRNNFPGVIDNLFYTRAQTKRVVKEQGIPIPDGVAASEIALANLNQPLVQAAIDVYAQKLLLALHYKHTGTIFSRSGAIVYSLYTNVHRVSGRIPVDVIRNLPAFSEVMRESIDLSTQFSYAFGHDPERRNSAFFAVHRNSFSIGGSCVLDVDAYEVPHDVRRLGPFP
jgi:hypothetical protein